MNPPIELTTENDLAYKFIPNSTGFYQFRIRAPHDCHLAFTTNSVESDPMYELIIGGWKNTKSVIRKNRSKPDVAEAETPGILSDQEYKGFWVRYDNNTLCAGEEGNPNPFISYTDNEFIPINYIGVCTGWGACGEWIIEEQRPRTEIVTEDKLEYTFIPNTSGYFTFRIRAAHDCHIAFTGSAAECDPMYEIFIGGWNNSKSIIRKNRTKPDVAEVETPGILSDGEFRGFWVRWDNGFISAGKEGDRDPFIMFSDNENVPINYIGICTGWGATGTWLL